MAPVCSIDEVVDQFRRAIELDPNLAKAHAGLGQAMKTKGDLVQALDLSRRSIELAPSDPDCLLFYSVTLFDSGDLQIATEMMEKAFELHPLPPSYYHFFHAMILWGNKRFKEALDEADQCLRKAPQFGGAEVYRTLALVGLGRIAEARAQLSEHVSRTAGPPTAPRPAELASRFLAILRLPAGGPLLQPSVQRFRQTFDKMDSVYRFSDFFRFCSGPASPVFVWSVYDSKRHRSHRWREPVAHSKPRLITFGISHFCEKARWALDWHRIPYDEIGWPPGWHLVLAKRCGARATTLPIILDGKTVIQGSGAIIDWAESRGNDPRRSLAPCGDLAEAQETERRADEVIGMHVRRLAYAETLPNCPHLVKPALFLRTSIVNRLIGNFMWPVTRQLMMRVYDIRPGAASESRSTFRIGARLAR